MKTSQLIRSIRLHRLAAMLVMTCMAGCGAWPKTTLPLAIAAGATADMPRYIRAHYTKRECLIPMRDGVKLFTIVYEPKNASDKRAFPIMLFRTPYSIGPYGADKFRESLGPNTGLVREGYIFAYQDVRGRYMSEGEFVNMTPHIDHKQSPHDIDESSDTFDTIDWLLKNVPHNNGRVGQWGISYPGFYSSAGMIDAHPALKAVSPQAPIADWYFDDFFHHGAFFLPHSFNFLSSFGRARPKPTTEGGKHFDHGTPDGYQFFLDLGPLRNANEKYFHHEVAFWDEMAAHPNRDAFWQARDLLPHLKRVAPAVMTVGGWFDAEDLYGALNTYRAIEDQNPGIFNMLVMGPWVHGGWARNEGDRLGSVSFDAKTSPFYQANIELPFFNHYLKDKDDPNLPEAYVFETGVNKWRTFDHWPPRDVQIKNLYLRENQRLSFDTPAEDAEAADEFISDPAKPVPFTEAVATGMTKEYMTDDQRFASRRTDVLTYQTDVLDESMTLAGPIIADLWVSTTATDADWIVKVIDVFPNDAPDMFGKKMGGYQMMVRSEVIRGRFRNSYEHPEPFEPNQPTLVKLKLQDVLHTVKKGHRLMVQIQSSWFPLVDRNPQKYVENIFEAKEDDFIKATHRVWRAKGRASVIEVGLMPAQPSQ